jgi:hypothetical protein
MNYMLAHLGYKLSPGEVSLKPETWVTRPELLMVEIAAAKAAQWELPALLLGVLLVAALTLAVLGRAIWSVAAAAKRRTRLGFAFQILLALAVVLAAALGLLVAVGMAVPDEWSLTAVAQLKEVGLDVDRDSWPSKLESWLD